MNWKYFNPIFEYEKGLQDVSLPWAGHKYFAYDLVRNVRPGVIVELGTFRGTSLFSLCQAVKDEKIDTELYAIDIWQGDEHSGFYGEDIYAGVQSIRDSYYANLDIHLLKKTFDEALSEFENDSIDLLHIDGLHTYEAVKHDFDLWFSKVKKDGIILFHDIVVTKDDFGVYKFWDELKKSYSTLEFQYSYGLGVLFKDNNNPIIEVSKTLELYYAYRLEDRENEDLAKLINKLDSNELELQKSNEIIRKKESELHEARTYLRQRESELYETRASLRWRIPNYFYKLYKNNIKKFIPRFVFRLKDILIILFYKLFYLFKKINFKKIKNSIIQSDPQITIGIASYNHSKYLRQCIESALNQDYKKYDILIVDDNSSDSKNKEILKEYESNERVTIIYNDKNEGISASLNKQILNAKGDWVAFMDCDDYLPTNALSAMASCIRSNSRFKLIYSNRIEVDENDKFLRKVWFGNRALNKNPFNELLKGMVSSHLKIIHKDAFRKVGMFDPRFGGTHDYDMFLRVAFYMPETFGFIDKYLYYHRIHGSQNTLVENDKHKKNVEIILREARFRKMVYSGEFDKKVSIVILSFNRFGQLKSTIDNILKRAKNINYEILIWDNGSSYEKVLEYLRSIDGKNRIRVVFSKENIKAAGGRREATKLVDGDYVLYFDNDIEVAKNFLEELVIRIEESDEIASCCARIIFPDYTVQYTGGLTEELSDGFINFHLDNAGRFDDDLNTMVKRDYDWLGTGATMTKRKYLHLANFDAGFINAYEDNDYYMQLVKSGLRIVHAPTASVIHHHVKYEIKKDVGTEKYVSVRHDESSFVASWAHFYKKWNLIIKDDFIFGIAGLKDKDDQDIKSYLANFLKNK